MRMSQLHPDAARAERCLALPPARSLLRTRRQHVSKVLSHTGQLRSELLRCLVAEFMGTLLFQIFGGAAPPKDTTAPAANGFALVCVVYTFANISGAHLNPAVSFALMCTGHMKWWRGLLYIVVQVWRRGAAAPHTALPEQPPCVSKVAGRAHVCACTAVPHAPCPCPLPLPLPPAARCPDPGLHLWLAHLHRPHPGPAHRVHLLHRRHRARLLRPGARRHKRGALLVGGLHDLPARHDRVRRRRRQAGTRQHRATRDRALALRGSAHGCGTRRGAALQWDAVHACIAEQLRHTCCD